MRIFHEVHLEGKHVKILLKTAVHLKDNNYCKTTRDTIHILIRILYEVALFYHQNDIICQWGANPKGVWNREEAYDGHLYNQGVCIVKFKPKSYIYRVYIYIVSYIGRANIFCLKRFCCYISKDTSYNPVTSFAQLFDCLMICLKKTNVYCCKTVDLF